MLNKHWSQLCSTGLGGQLIRSSIGSVLLKVLNAMAVFVVSVILSRVLGPEQFGIYSYTFSLLILLAIITRAGLPDLLIREVAGYRLEGKWEHIRGIIRFSDRVVFALSGTVVTIALLVFCWYQHSWGTTEKYTYLWAFLLLPILNFSALRGGSIRGLGYVVVGQFPEMLLRTGGFLILLLFILLSGHSLTPQSAMATHVVAGLLALAFGVCYCKKILITAEGSGRDTTDTRKWFRDLLPFTILTGVMVVDRNVDIIMLGWLAENKDVGIYRVATQTVVIVAFVLSSLNMVIAPQITRLFHAGEMEKLQRMVTIGARVIAVTSVPLAMMLIIWGDLFITKVFGERFAPAALPLAILCIGQIINTLMGINGTVLNMTQYASESAWIVAGGSVLNVILNLCLIPVYGTEGAAIATASSLALWNILLSWRVYRQLGIKTTVF